MLLFALPPDCTLQLYDDANIKKKKEYKKKKEKNEIRYNVAGSSKRLLFNCKEKMSFETMVMVFVKNHQTRGDVMKNSSRSCEITI